LEEKGVKGAAKKDRLDALSCAVRERENKNLRGVCWNARWGPFGVLKKSN